MIPNGKGMEKQPFKKPMNEKRIKKQRNLERVGRIYGFDEGNGRIKMIF